MLTILGIILIILGIVVTTLSIIFELKYKRGELIIGVIIGMVAIQIGGQLYTAGQITNAIRDSRDLILNRLP